MSPPGTGHEIFRFGAFELASATGELRKNGLRLKLQDQPVRILILLLENVGEVVTREQIQKQLWPGGVYVDYENAINSAVRKLREALIDTSDNPRFVETLPRRGYRFVAPVTKVLTDASGSGVAPGQQPGVLPQPLPLKPMRLGRHRPLWRYYAAGGVPCAAAIAALWFLGPGRSAAPFHATVLTSFVGLHAFPNLSPDGNQFAFAWDGDVPKGKPHVYISLVGKGTPLRLTPENEAGTVPAWSPDGQSIAYIAYAPGLDPELRLMPALGGPGRKITSGSFYGTVSWSPDSKWLFWVESGKSGISAIHVAPAGGGEPRQLLDPLTVATGPANGDHDPALSPDGRHLIFSRYLNGNYLELFVADFDAGRVVGTPRRLTHDHMTKSSPIWTSDGKEIIYIAGQAAKSDLAIYRMRVSGGEPQLIDGIGANANYLTLARKINRLIYSTLAIDMDIHRLDLTAADAKPERFLSSRRYDGQPSYSPDGKRIAFASNRDGVDQIWVTDADGGNTSRLTSFSSNTGGVPKWSPDGQFIVFDARPEDNSVIYTVPSGGGQVTRLTYGPVENHVPFWSRDNWIYFGSSRLGGTQIFRMRPDGSMVQQVTHNGGFYGEVSADGKWLYYSVPTKGLWKMPPDGGEAIQVLAPPLLNTQFSFGLMADGIYAMGTRQPEGFPVVFYPFDGRTPRTLTTLSRPASLFMTVSPDGRWFLYASADDPVYGIMLVDNFR